jgi:hypothetical protein
MPAPRPLRGAGTLRKLRSSGTLRGRGAVLNIDDSLRKLRSWEKPARPERRQQRVGLAGDDLVGEQFSRDEAERGAAVGERDS